MGFNGRMFHRQDFGWHHCILNLLYNMRDNIVPAVGDRSREIGDLEWCGKYLTLAYGN